MSRRFRWTRAAYRKAHSMARMFSRFNDLPYNEPPILQRYFELWNEYRQNEDPLLVPFSRRTRFSDSIPF